MILVLSSLPANADTIGDSGAIDSIVSLSYLATSGESEIPDNCLLDNSISGNELQNVGLSDLDQIDHCSSSVQDFTYYQTGGLWSGFVVGTNYDKYVEVKGFFTTPPRTDNSNQCGYSNWGGWVGLGGVHSQKLLQIGITRNLYSDYTDPSKTYILFIEYINGSDNNGPYYVTTRKLAPGVGVLLSMTYNVSAHKATFFMDDGSRVPYNFTTSGDMSAYYDGSSAEWIDEIPNGASSLYNFGTITWSDLQVKDSNGSWLDFGSEPGHGYKIVDTGNATVAAPIDSSVTGTGFKDKYYACN